MLSIKLFNKIAVETDSQKTDEAFVTAFNGEVAAFGYTLDPLLMDALRTIGDDAFLALRDSVLSDIATIKGAKKTYTRLFNGFPYSTPDQHEYMEQRILGHMANELNITLGGNRITMLSCGHVIDSALFNVEEFGACPICQMQVPELSSTDEAKYDFKSVTPLTFLGVSTDNFRAESNALLARKSSLSEDEKTFLRAQIEKGVEFDLPDSLYRENVPFAYKLFGAKVGSMLSGATDVLRIATFLSNASADLSLSENTKFKLSTSQKRDILAMLEQRRNLAEDMLRHREKWLRLGERLNPGSSKNKARFPKTAAAFDRLRNDPNSIVTFNKQKEESLRAGAVDQSFVDLMIERPGEYARALDAMLRKAEDASIVVEGFGQVVSRIPERTLLDLRKYLTSRSGSDMRIFIPKGRVNKMQVVEDRRAPLPEDAVASAIEKIDADLRARFAERGEMGKVYIDPMLKEIVLPFNRRGDSSSSSPLTTKGSRVPFNGDFIRMFVWWHDVVGADSWNNRVDVDLSIVQFDENMKQMGYTSFQNLRSSASVHSGDIQSAPNGASEFIDFDVNKMASSGVRYVAASVISFTGQPFDAFECFVGFMERDGLRSGKVYEPESVKLRYDLKGTNKSAIPLLFDVVERKVIYADLSTGGSRYGAVSGQEQKNTALTKAMLAMPERKPTLFDIAYLNASARGTIVDTPEEADVVIDIDAAMSLEQGA